MSRPPWEEPPEPDEKPEPDRDDPGLPPRLRPIWKHVEPETVASSVASTALAASPLSQPFGGPRWPQREGYTIRAEIERSTASVILPIIEEEIENHE